MENAFEALSINAVGTTISAPNGSSSAATAIPNDANGNRARYVRVQAQTGPAHLKFGLSGVAATTNDTLINANFDRIFNVRSNTHFAVWGAGAATNVNVVAVEA